jgi:hypothetical protein
MRQGRLREITAATDACVARALDFIGTHNAPAEELAAVDRLREAQAAGPLEGVIVALAEVGRLQRCPSGFWREVEQAATLVLPQHSPTIGPVERARRERFHTRLQHLRSGAEAEPGAAADRGLGSDS